MGFRTLPIKPGSKEPATAHGVKDATDDDVATDAYYATHPKHGIGIAGDGFVIFDFDVKDGIDGRDQLLGWNLPDTLCQTTPSGGYHMIYRTDDEIRPSVNQALAVDVRGWHSYIVCDPTPGYCFEDDCEPAEANEAVMAFLNHVRPKANKSEKQRRGKQSDKISEGGRNDYLHKQGCSMRAKEVPDDEIRAFGRLHDANMTPALVRAEFEIPLVVWGSKTFRRKHRTYRCHIQKSCNRYKHRFSFKCNIYVFRYRHNTLYKECL